MIIIDSNENSKNPNFYEAFVDVEIEVKVENLSSGDFLIIGDRNCVVERKSVFDLLGSLKDRMWDQLDRMKNDYINTQCRIIVDGYWKLMRKRDWNEASVYAQLDSIIAKDGWDVPILFTPDIDGTIIYLIWKNSSLGEPKEKRQHALRASVDKSLDTDKQAKLILQGYPLIGPKTSDKLISHFGSIKDIVNATLPELREVVGEKTSLYIFTISNYEVNG